MLKSVKSAKVAHLATAASNLQPYVTPVVFVVVNKYIFIPLDHKPKAVSYKELKRVRNIQENSRVAFLVDNYKDNWQALWFIMLIGHAYLVEPQEISNRKNEFQKIHNLIKKKYLQYSKVGVGEAYVKIHIQNGFYWSFSNVGVK